jgi:hypothetical protein
LMLGWQPVVDLSDGDTAYLLVTNKVTTIP